MRRRPASPSSASSPRAAASARARSLASAAHPATSRVRGAASHRGARRARSRSPVPSGTTTLCRELTKQFETIATMPARELPAWLAADPNRSRGEFVLVLHALAATPPRRWPGGHDAVLAPLLAALPLKQAVALAGEITGAPRNALYARALEIRIADSGAPRRNDRRRDSIQLRLRRDLRVVLLGVDVLARVVLHAVQLLPLLGADDAVGLGLVSAATTRACCCVETVRLDRPAAGAHRRRRTSTGRRHSQRQGAAASCTTCRTTQARHVHAQKHDAPGRAEG